MNGFASKAKVEGRDNPKTLEETLEPLVRAAVKWQVLPPKVILDVDIMFGTAEPNGHSGDFEDEYENCNPGTTFGLSSARELQKSALSFTQARWLFWASNTDASKCGRLCNILFPCWHLAKNCNCRQTDLSLASGQLAKTDFHSSFVIVSFTLPNG